MDFLCLDFINGRLEDTVATKDAFPEDTVWVTQLCLKWDLPVPDASTMAALSNLYKTVSRAVREYSESGAIPPAKLADINSYLSSVSHHNLLELDTSGYCLHEIPRQAENTLLPYRIIMSFVDLVVNHGASRLKVCENPDCGWVFYDESKSRTRRWCDNTCASLIKVRRFREKRLQA